MVLVAVVLGLAAVGGHRAARFDAGRPSTTPPSRPCPTRDLTGADVRGVQFAVTARGYSIAQVDELLDRLAGQLDGPFPASAIMEVSEFSQSGREGEHGSNEAPHG